MSAPSPMLSPMEGTGGPEMIQPDSSINNARQQANGPNFLYSVQNNMMDPAQTPQPEDKDANEPGQPAYKMDSPKDANGQEGDANHHHANGETSESGTTEETNSECSGEEAVKLFVGQVPKSLEESDLFPIFQKYGPMEDVAIIRDKLTGQHRGCAFISFFSKESADACELDLHNNFTFEGGKRPVQIRPAGRKEEIENKVFVGMLPRDVQEETVRQLFEPFGEIKGIFLIRSSDGIKKGCAFVKYTERESAIAAIANLNGQIALEDSDRPLIVKIADTKNQKKQRQTQHSANHGMYAGHETPVAHSPQGSFNGNMYFIPPNAPPPGQVPVSHHPLFPSQVPGLMAGNYADSSNNGSPAGSYTSQAQFPASYHNNAHVAGSHHPPSYVYQQLHYDNSHYTDHSRALHQQQHQQKQQSQKPREGPAGANLFIYHLPHDLTDADLATAFNPFGNVISAKVYVDRFTGESKGFGFVSYDSIIAAEHAIEQMNGFQIGNKRLKVQHKRVNHRPPVPAMQSAVHHAYYQLPHHSGPMHQMPVHDVPPAIEISGSTVGGDNGYNTSNTQQGVNGMSHPSMYPQHDVDTLTSQFGSLQTSNHNNPV
mmetsp:Transcript_202/g.281  ORF Transcript_202/g.281 Transcript_202/m.281 type:complete len:599 (+) Transcript_202:388-2184(+)